MLGIQSWGVLSAYLLCLASAGLCIGYGLWRWNRDEEPPQASDVQWAKTEAKEEEAAQ